MVLNAETYPQRKKLPHEIPSWVGQGIRHYITINCRHRGTEYLCREPVARALLRSGESYEYIEKARYIRMNPVRKGLVVSVKDWPFVIDRSNSDYGTARQGRLALPGMKKWVR